MSKEPPNHGSQGHNGRTGPGDGHLTTPPEHGRQSMWLSDLSIKQPVFITMLVVAVVLIGWLSYSRLPLNLMPDISLQTISVSTVYPGAAPAEVERAVTKPIEDALASVSGVETVRSTSAESLSQVSVDFDSNIDIKTATEEVRNRISLIRNSLPSDVQEPMVSKMDTGAMPIIVFAVADSSGSRSAQEVRSLVDTDLKDRFERLEGVGSVMVAGGDVPEVHVDLDLARLHSYGVSPQQVTQAIRGESMDLPGGRITQGPTEQLVRTAGRITSLKDLSSVQLTTSRGAVVTVGDLGAVSLTRADVRSHLRLNGQDSVMVIILKQSGANTVKVADNVQVGLKELKAQYPDLSFGTVFDQSTFTREAIGDVQLTLILGGILAALVVLLFFRDLRNTLVTVAGLPVVVLGTFVVLYAFGISLNMISMMALSLSIGLLIDDAIVVRENIYRHMERGDAPKVAAAKGAAEIAMAVIAVTSTIVAVFLPIAFTEGMVGMFLRDFGITITAAVLISLVEAFTLAPMLSAIFFHRMDPAHEEARRRSRFFRAFEAINESYGRLLAWSLRHRRIVVAVGVAALVASLALVPMMTQSFQSTADQGEFAVMMELGPDASPEEADRAVRKAEDAIRTEPLVSEVFSSSGSSSTTGGSANIGSLGVKLKTRGHTTEVLERVRPVLAAELPGVRLTYNKESAAAGALGSAAAGMIQSQPIQYKIQGRDYSTLEQLSGEVASRLERVPGIVDVDRSVRAGAPQQVIVLDRTRAKDLGVSATQVASTVRSLLTGDVAGTFQTDEKDVDIRVRLAEKDRDALEEVLALPLVTSKGTQLPLSSVAAMLPSTEPAKIQRENRQRLVLVSASTDVSDSGSALASAQAAVASIQLPEGVSLKAGGDAEMTAEAFASLGMAIGLSVAFMYMILASQFGSFVHPFTIMLALPFSIIGALLSLLLMGKSLDSMAMIGMILLMGLVTKNSILLVEFINQLRSQGLSTREAILHAGPVRLRPILMTTLSMVFGMLPTAIGLGAGAELRQTMGVSVIGGVITSTVLTLLVVPVAYSIIDDIGRWIVGRFRPGASRAGKGVVPKNVESVTVEG